jgi:diguanylate cyclase (GGDEF)-like protein/PAS domain S-box-containing protein
MTTKTDHRVTDFKEVFNALPSRSVLVGSAGEIIAVNRAWRQFAEQNGIQPGYDWHSVNYFDVCQSAGDDPHARSAEQAIRSILFQRVPEFCLTYRCESVTEEFWFQMRGARVEVEDSANVLIIHEDVTTLKQAELIEALRSAAVFNAVDEAIMITDIQNRIVQVNASFEKITGYSSAEVVGHSPAVLSSGNHSKQFYENMWRSLQDAGTWNGELQNRRKSGEVFTEYLSINRVRNPWGEVILHVGIFRDITEQKAVQDEIHGFAYTDSLTGLPNRRQIIDRLQTELEHSGRRESKIAILFVDLDFFKEVNDTYGHNVGDEILVAVASRLKKSVRKTDVVGRLGGDEFVVVLIDILNTKRVEALAGLIVGSLSEAFDIGGHDISISASVGIAIGPVNGTDARELLDQADSAMYSAKESGRGRYSRL